MGRCFSGVFSCAGCQGGSVDLRRVIPGSTRRALARGAWDASFDVFDGRRVRPRLSSTPAPRAFARSLGISRTGHRTITPVLLPSPGRGSILCLPFLCPISPCDRDGRQQVTGTEGVAVDVEAYEGSEAGVYELHGSHWISVAAANVLPKVIVGGRACCPPPWGLIVAPCAAVVSIGAWFLLIGAASSGGL